MSSLCEKKMVYDYSNLALGQLSDCVPENLLSTL